MRNVYDQYSQPENKLTHSLASTLQEDKGLLKSFLKHVGCADPGQSAKLHIIEQSIAGDLEPPEDEAERRGLPDAWIYNDDGWCLLIESKVESRLTTDQLVRHYRTAERCGFDDITVLSIEAFKTTIKPKEWLLSTTWAEIYEWLIGQKASSRWARSTADYFEVAERKFTDAGYLKEGNITVFAGIPFCKEIPYNYAEAKRLIKLALEEIRKDTAFCRDAKINPNVGGRGAITGTKSKYVWDFLRLDKSSGEDSHTAFPHFTFSISDFWVHTSITIPNSIQNQFRKNLTSLGYERFRVLIAEVVENLEPLIDREPRLSPWCTSVQRRYPSQRSVPIVDATLEFDLRTAIESTEPKVKPQEAWLIAAYDTLCNKKSNYQIQIGAVIPFEDARCVPSKELLSLVKGIWLACRPLLDVVVEDR
ncbi:hypothetical protein [Teredinibacter franksiae]|uniref:hypothetical protein n=1 Tax=Teredinibacter franksiae TaxID=2761453 RepID=UPI001623E1DD|nr:hypothetical protein [Teredinibacter franksiae]